MAIRNINTIQNENDLNYISTVSQEYLAQSLANLGQRLGVQGDSILTANFLFNSLIDGENYDPQKNMGFIKYADDVYSLGICEKNNINYVKRAVEVNNTKDYLITSEVCKLTKAINNIDGYDANGRIITDANFYTFAFTGIQQKSNQAVSYEEYICERVNKFNNNIDCAIRFRKFGRSNSLKMVYIVKDATIINKYHVYVYNSLNYTIQLSDVTTIINNLTVATLSPEVIFNNKEIRKLFVNDSQAATFDKVYVSDDKTITIEDEESKFTKLDYDKNTLLKVLTWFAYDVTYLYRFVKNYYSEIVYNFDNEELKRHIIVELFKIITAENSAANDIIYIPLNYVFNYAYNSGTPWHIYYSSLDVITKYVTEDRVAAMVSDSDESAFICSTTKPERVAFYNYSVDYDQENNNTVYNINAYKHFTLPYINGNNYWVLNDVDSNIFARGINAGNPNIVLIKTDNDAKKPTIISAASYNNIFSKLSWKREVTVVKRIKFVNVNTETSNPDARFLLVNCAIPDLSNVDANEYDEYKVGLENALIINMCKMNCVVYGDAVASQYKYTKEDVEDEYGSDAVITTLWHLNTSNMKFECIMQSEQISDTERIRYAVDFNYIANTSNLIDFAVRNHEQRHPDKYLHEHVVFANAYANMKNNVGNEVQFAYPNIVNKQSAEYNSGQHKTNDVGLYSNEFNLFIKYNDIIGSSSTYVSYINQSEKRYYETSNSNVTPALYSYRNNNNYFTYLEYVPNYNVPTLDLGEILTRNETVINKINILSFNKDGKVYNSYIGTAFDNIDKSALIIGSSKMNVNMGNETLLDYDERDKFNTQLDIKLDFDNTFIRKDEYIGNDSTIYHDTITYNINWTRKDNPYNKTTYWSTQFTPTARYIYEKDIANNKLTGIVNLIPENKELLTSYSYISYIAQPACFNNALRNNKLYVITRVNEMFNDDGSNNTNIYLGDGLYIPQLLNLIGQRKYVSAITTNGAGIISMPNVNIKSNMNIYSYQYIVNNITTYTPLVLLGTSHVLYDNDLYRYNVVEDEEVFYTDIIDDFTGGYFNTNDLAISYYETNNKLYLTVNELKTNDYMPYIYKLKENYTK